MQPSNTIIIKRTAEGYRIKVFFNASIQILQQNFGLIFWNSQLTFKIMHSEQALPKIVI